VHMVGEPKRDCLLALAKQHDLNLNLSYAYGDSSADCAMLECVGHPEAVNPVRRLARAARKRGWTVSRWNLATVARANGPGPVEIGSAASAVAAAGRSR
jgi:phosphoserine phosphatase